MRNLLLLIVLFSLMATSQGFAQNIEKDYQFISSVNTGLTRKMYANEVMFDENQQYLIVNYGNKPTYIVVFKYASWEPIVNFRLPDWVEFSGAFVDYERNDLYIKASRYSTEFYKLNITNGTDEIRECTAIPGGCPADKPKQSEKSVFSLNKEYYIAINKKNARDVRIYRRR